MGASKDEKQGRHVQGGRVSRFLKLGGLTGTVGATLLGERLLGAVRSPEGRAEATRRTLGRNAERIVRTMGEMKGAAMKLGQMLSVAPIHQDDLPPEVREALSVLQRSAPPMSWETVTAAVEDAFDLPVEAVYRRFDPEPLAAASIGQVHRAELFDGTPVAVKIQYPGVAESLEADLKNLASLMQLGRAFADRARLDGWLAEVRETLLAESDYEAEAANLERFAGLLASQPELRVPRPVRELTRRTVLTMEYVEGEKLDTWLERQPEAVRNRVALRFVEIFVGLFHDHRALHADPHPGNFLVDPEGRLVLLDFGCVRDFDPAFTDGFLHVLAAMWAGRWDRLPGLFEDLGFGGGGGVDASPEVLRGWMERVTAPFLTPGDFDFGAWAPHRDVRRYFMQHPELMKLTPPREAIFYWRVCGGLWGFLQRLGVRGDFRAMAMETARRRGVVAPGAGRAAGD